MVLERSILGAAGLATKLMIRGIYSTALVRLALREGTFEIVSPTESQKRRFGLSENNEPPDINIGDTTDRHGIKLIGAKEKIEEFVEALKRANDNIAVWWKDSRDDGSPLCVVSFPMQGKETMDRLREEITYTVPYHHYCRAGSEGLSLMVSLAEKMVEEGLADANKVSEMFTQEITRLMPRIGSTIRIIHTKLSGKIIQLTPGKVIWRREGEIKVVRKILGGGVYDGLGIPKSLGDTAIMLIKRGQPYTITRYYGVNNILKGEYYNICTPVEMYDSYVRYIDLGVDVVKPANKEARIVDLEELENGYKRGVIAEKMYNEAKQLAEEILNKIS